jgi:hypothetical protein
MSPMKIDKSISFNRRGFLKSAGLLGGAAAFDFWPQSGVAASPAARQYLTTVSYLSDDGLVEASALPSGDSSLIGSGVYVTIQNYSLPDGTKPLFRGFMATFLVENGEQSEPVPFYAWAPANPVKQSRFFMPVLPANGIYFSILTNDDQFPVESYYLSADSTRHAAKLRTGMYVIASRLPGAGYEPKTERGVVRLLGTNDETPYFEHLLVNITGAE